MLTVDTAAARLLALHLLAPQAVLDGDLEITSITRRNRNLLVSSRGPANYLLKQAESPHADSAQTLRTEARLYDYCFQPARAAAFAPLMPRVVLAAPEGNLLIISLFKDAVPLWRYYRTRTAAQFPVATVAAVGQLLRQFHRLASPLATDPDLAFLPTELPFAFRLHEPSPQFLSYASQGTYQLLEAVQRSQPFVAALNEVGATWELNSLIHGDIKMDNFLVLDPAAAYSAGSTQVRLIDWEMAQLGDAAWDAAGVLQDFVFWWVISMPMEDEEANLVAKASFPVRLVQAGVAAFWASYCQADPATEALLPKVVRFAACRLLQTAYELSSRFDYIPRPASILLQIAMNLLTNLERGARDLFGLTLPAAALAAPVLAEAEVA